MTTTEYREEFDAYWFLDMPLINLDPKSYKFNDNLKLLCFRCFKAGAKIGKKEEQREV